MDLMNPERWLEMSNQHSSCARGLRRLFALMLAAVLATGCEYPFGPVDGRITFENRTGAPLLFLALDRNDAAFTDPYPVWNVDEHPDRLLAPGEARKVEVYGYVRGEDLLVWLYPVRDQSGQAQLTGTVIATDAELRASGYRVRLDEEAVRR